VKTLPIESDGGKLYVTFTDELIDELGWNVGDDLDWEINSDGLVTLTKHDETTSPDRPSSPLAPMQECTSEVGSPVHDC